MANKINQIEIDSIIYDLQDKDAKAPFTGTKAEVQAAIAAGEIKEGDIVNITDDINDYPGGGGDYPSGASNIVYLTQEQYDALPDDKLTDDIEYRIMDEGFEATAVNVGYDNSKSGLSAETVQEAVDELSRRPSGGGGESNIVYLTQEQYDDLPDSKLTDGVEYRVTDAGVRGSAENVSYDGSTSGLNAKNVQEAVDGLHENVKKHIVCNDTTAIPILQAYKDNEYGAVRLQGCYLEDPNPSINLYRKYNKEDTAFERALAIFFNGTDFYGLGKTQSGETIRKVLNTNSTGDLTTIVTSDYCTINSCNYEKNGNTTVLLLNITTTSEVPYGGILLDNIPLRPVMNGTPITLRKYSGGDEYKAVISRTEATNINQIRMYDTIPSGTTIRAEIVYTAMLY